MPKQIQTWRFTTTDSQGKVRAVVTIEAKRDADIIAALASLRAPLATIKLIRHNGAGLVRRFTWDTPTSRVSGVRA